MRLTAVGGILALATASLALNVTLILVLASPFAWRWKAVLTLAYVTVNKNRELLHPSEGIGRKGLRLAGSSVIGTLRLVNAGIWPEEDGTLARSWLADRRVAGSDPVDYTLSTYLDGLAEKTLLGIGTVKPEVAEIVHKARLDYEVDAKRRRSERPNLLGKQVEALQTRNAELEASNVALKAEVEKLRAERAAAPALQSAPEPKIGHWRDRSRRRPSGPEGLRP